MVKLELQVSEDLIQETERVLKPMGIDVEMAVTIFLRRIAYDKRFPLDLTVPQMEHLDDQESGIRSYTAITKEMIDELWISFQRYMDGSDELGNLGT